MGVSGIWNECNSHKYAFLRTQTAHLILRLWKHMCAGCRLVRN